MAYHESEGRRRDPDGADLDAVAGPDAVGAEGGGDSYEDTIEITRSDGYDGVDDAANGERDRMAVHVVWECVLLVGTAALAFLTYRGFPDALRGFALDRLLVAGTALGLLAMAAGVALRAGAPNLALGPVALASAHYVTEQGSVAVALLPAIVSGLALGLVLAVFVAGFHVPSWAASLAAALAVTVWPGQLTGAGGGPVSDWDPTLYSGYLYGGFAALSVLGGLFGLVRVVRHSLGRFRPVSDPAVRRGAGAAVVTAAALVWSTWLAVLAGVLLATGPGMVQASGFEWSGLAIGAALLGGTSAFGRRGGVLGGLLAVTLLMFCFAYVELRGWDVSAAAVAAAAIALGLVVTRLVETFGRARTDWDETGDDGDGWVDTWLDPQESWSFALPAEPTDPRADRWRK
jgi:ribose/xylose/arabinose/galactoside ABC-type transport system permease subunit